MRDTRGELPSASRAVREFDWRLRQWSLFMRHRLVLLRVSFQLMSMYVLQSDIDGCLVGLMRSTPPICFDFVVVHAELPLPRAGSTCARNCHGQATLQRNTTDPSEFDWSAIVPMLDGSGRSVSICSVPHGGGACTSDSQCGRQGGLCLAGSCVCTQGWMCPYCTMTQTDLQYGLRCGIPDGGASCAADKDCNHGRCIITAGGSPPPFCQCNPLYACANCSQNVLDLARNKTTCS
jgi:hypothetical protein